MASCGRKQSDQHSVFAKYLTRAGLPDLTDRFPLGNSFQISHRQRRVSRLE